ncbi:hypothetical protein [Tsuneonella sp. HG222]
MIEWEMLRIKLEDAHMARALAVKGLTYDTPAWNDAYHEASAPVFAVWDEMKAIEKARYEKAWGENCTYSYLTSSTSYEERRAAKHAMTRLAVRCEALALEAAQPSIRGLKHDHRT